MTGFDIIGDIHGHADALCLMLETLGYSAARGVYRHPRRTAVFVGDYIDRGPKQREVLRIVQAMCAAGFAHAAMGNHEFNALAWATHPTALAGTIAVTRMSTGVSTRPSSNRSAKAPP